MVIIRMTETITFINELRAVLLPISPVCCSSPDAIGVRRNREEKGRKTRAESAEEVPGTTLHLCTASICQRAACSVCSLTTPWTIKPAASRGVKSYANDLQIYTAVIFQHTGMTFSLDFFFRFLTETHEFLLFCESELLQLTFSPRSHFLLQRRFDSPAPI